MKKQFAFFSAVIILFSACSKSSSGGGYNNTGGNTGGSGNTVAISNFAFNSSDLHVTAGTTVTWTNNDNTTHTVTADDNSFNSGDLTNGKTFSHTFSTAGTYHYHCNYHSMMKAEIVVQ